MLLLLATFAVGLKCFFDFDKGLYDSKTSGQLFPRCLCFPHHGLIFMVLKRIIDTLLLKPRRTSAYNTPGEKPDPFGQPLEPRLSIE